MIAAACLLLLAARRALPDRAHQRRGRPATRARAGHGGGVGRGRRPGHEHRQRPAASRPPSRCRSARRCTATASPRCAAGGRHEESFTIRTEHRGVIAVGPATTRRGDPIGIFSRDMVWTPVREVLVRPPLLPLESLGAGLLRDLEGVSTDAVSQSDLAFHALREYVPGDDLRHIHWRSSAKVMASTRRVAACSSGSTSTPAAATPRSSSTTVESAWADPDDFETAMSVAASIAVRAMLDEFEVSFVCGEHGLVGHRRAPRPRRRLPGRASAPTRPRQGRPPGHPGRPRQQPLLPHRRPGHRVQRPAARRRGLPAGGTPLRDPDRPVGQQPRHRGGRPAGPAPRRQERPRRAAALERQVSDLERHRTVDTVTGRAPDWPDLHHVLDLAFVVAADGLALSGFATVVHRLGLPGRRRRRHGARGPGRPTRPRAALAADRPGADRGAWCSSCSAARCACARWATRRSCPGGCTLGTLTDQVLFGWKDMLTTLPPVDGDGPLLVLPWTLGLVAGFVGALLVARPAPRARGSRRCCPCWPDALSLVAVILLGVRHPQSVVAAGRRLRRRGPRAGWPSAADASAATVHGGIRGSGGCLGGARPARVGAGRARQCPWSRGHGRRRRPHGAALLGRAALRHRPLPLAAGGLPQLRRPARQPSEPANVYEKALFRVDGAPAGARVRFATIDRYDGLVWGASNDALPGEADDSFQRVSSTIDNPVEGDAVEATVTIGEGYGGVWLPTIGALQAMDFGVGTRRPRPSPSATTSPPPPPSYRPGCSPATATPSPPCARRRA